MTLVHHKADVVRLEALLEHGGVYLDMDNFLMRGACRVLVTMACHR